MNLNNVPSSLVISKSFPVTVLHSSAFRWSATVVRQRRHVFYRGDTQSRLLQRGDRRFAAGAGTLDPNFNLAHPITHRGAGTTLCSPLSRKRRTLARAFETHAPRGARTYRVAVQIRNRNQSIVKGRPYMYDSSDNVFSDFSLYLFSHCRSRVTYSSDEFASFSGLLSRLSCRPLSYGVPYASARCSGCTVRERADPFCGEAPGSN